MSDRPGFSNLSLSSNCTRCGKVFVKLLSPICRDCTDGDEANFNAVREYVRKNTDNDITRVSEATGVPVKTILRFLKEERLESSEGFAGQMLLSCDRCDEPINTGTLCESCRLGHRKDLQAMQTESKKTGVKTSGVGMHSAPKLSGRNRR